MSNYKIDQIKLEILGLQAKLDDAVKTKTADMRAHGIEPVLIEKYNIELEDTSEYNPEFGDDKLCTCSDPYYRHFDPFENWEHCGCKYRHSCGCTGFELKDEDYVD